MAEHKMVVVDGVRYRPDELPERPKHAAVLEPDAGAKTGETAGAGETGGADTAGITTVDDDGDEKAPAKRTSAKAKAD